MSDGRLFCIAVSGIVPIRKEPAEQSEMLSQMLLGETAAVRSIEDRWVEIEADLDGYKGWVSKNQLQLLKFGDYQAWRTNPSLQRSVHATYKIASQTGARLVPVTAIVSEKSGQISVPGFVGQPLLQPHTIRQGSIIDTAIQFLGTPYLWGGRTDTGIDCSGLMQTVYLLHGITIPRDSGPQARAKPFKSEHISDAQPGDSIYFAFDGGPISHVGIYLGGGSLLHASASVCIQNIDYTQRFDNKYPLNERLANAISGIQAPFTENDFTESESQYDMTSV